MPKPDDLFTVDAFRSGPPDRRPAIVVAPPSDPMLVLLPSDEDERATAIRDLAVSIQAAGGIALAKAGAVLLAPIRGSRDVNPATVEEWAKAIGCEVITCTERR